MGSRFFIAEICWRYTSFYSSFLLATSQQRALLLPYPWWLLAYKVSFTSTWTRHDCPIYTLMHQCLQSYYTQNIISYNDIITVIILTDRLLSDTIINIVNGRLAQLGEHLPYKQMVGGSIPSTSYFFFFTKNIIKTSRLGQSDKKIDLI